MSNYQWLLIAMNIMVVCLLAIHVKLQLKLLRDHSLHLTMRALKGVYESDKVLQRLIWALDDKVSGLDTKRHIEAKVNEKLANHAYDKAILALSRSAAVEKSSYIHQKYNKITNILKQDLQSMEQDNPFARTMNPSNESILDYYPPGSEYEDEIDEFNNPTGFENGTTR